MSLKENLKPMLSVVPQSSSGGSLNGTSFDVSGYKDVMAIIAAGAIAAAATVDGKLQHCDDNSTWVDVSGEAITQLVTGSANTIGTVLKYRRHAGSAKKYLRLVITVAGTGAALVTGILIGGEPAQAPVT